MRFFFVLAHLVVIHVNAHSEETIPAQLSSEFYIGDLSHIEVLNNKVIEKEHSGKLSDIYNKNLSGTLGTFNSFDKNGSHTNIHFIKSRYDGNYEDFDLALEGILHSTNIELVHVRKDGIPETEEFPDKLTFSYNNDGFILQEAYISKGLSTWSAISMGRSIVTWGQFEPISPINLVFPLNFTPTDTRLSKSALTLPQDNVSLSVYINKDVVVTGYYFPTLNFHPLIEKGNINAKIPQYIIVPTSPGIDGVGIGDDIELTLPSKGARRQYGIRTMFYGNNTTLGISYYDGWDVNRITKFDRLHTITFDDTDYHIVEKKIGFAKQEAFGLEVSIIYADWTLISEFSISRGIEELTFLPYYEEDTVSRRKYIRWIKEKNDGKLYVPVNTLIASLGASRSIELWRMRGALFTVRKKYSQKIQEGLGLSEEVYQGTKDDGSFPIYPIFDISRYINKDKESAVGLAGGVFGYGYGGKVYLNQTFDESLDLGIAFNQITYFIEDVLVPEEYKDSYENEGSGTTTQSISIDLSYRF